MDPTLVALYVSVVGNIGLITVAVINRRTSPAQKESEIIKNYGELIEQYRTKIIELRNELDRVEKEKQEDAEAHEIEIKNHSAVMLKKQIEYEQEISRLQHELESYQIGWAKMRRVAVKYVPKDVTLPEIDGVTTVDLK